MDLERIDTWLERCIFGVVIAILVIGPLATGSTRLQDFALLQGLTLVGVALWGVRIWLTPGTRLLWPPICWAVLAFVIYAIIRYRQADVEYVARLELNRILVYAALFFIVLNNLHRQETTQWLLGVVLVLGTLIAGYAIYQFLSHSKFVWHFPKPAQYEGRGSGTFICPNHLAGFLEMLFPVALGVVFLSRSKALTRVFYAYMALVMLTGIAVSISRGGWISSGAVLLVFFAFLFRKPSYRKYVIAAVLVLGVATFLFVRKAAESRKRFRLALQPGQMQDVRIRPNLWVPAYQMWRDHPWLGVGPGHFDLRFPAYRPVTVQSRPLWVHNDYLNALTDWGVAGGSIIALFLGCLAWGTVRTWKYVGRSKNDLAARPSDRSAYVLGLATGIGAILIHSIVDFNMQIPANAILAFVMIASLSSHIRFATETCWANLRLLRRLAITGAFLGIAIYLAPETLRNYREGAALTRADGATTGTSQLAALRSAHQVEPMNAETVGRLGEIARLKSWEGGDTWEQHIQEAMRWFELGQKLNPHETYHLLRYGMCLDWQKRYEEAEPYFDRAVQMDPNNYYNAMLRGWHAIQRGDYPAAKKWLERSIEIKSWANFLAYRYLKIVNERLTPNATRQP